MFDKISEEEKRRSQAIRYLMDNISKRLPKEGLGYDSK